MFKKIQKYLLLTHPLLWNTKIIPMGCIILLFNLLFFLFGYFSTNINRNEYLSYDGHFLPYLISVLTSVLIVIIWLVYYLKNNGFKSFYPKTAFSLYKEWIIIFLLLFGNTLYSFSFTQGVSYKERTYASREEITRVLKILKKTELLLPESNNYYLTDKTEDYYNIPDSISAWKKASLLDFKSYSYSDTLDYHTVKIWLKEEKKDSILALMTNFLALQKKFNLETNLTTELWMKLLYHPPYYPVSPGNYINQDKYYQGYYKSAYPKERSDYFTEYRTLSRIYYKLDEAYNNPVEIYILSCLYIALGLSILLFSFRITTGKSWLIGLVTAGLLCFINGIIISVSDIIIRGNDKELFYLIACYWSLIFIISSIYLANKLIISGSKGKSAIVLNVFLWLFPFWLLILYGCYMGNSPRYTDNMGTLHYSPTYLYFDNNPTVFFWINLIFVTIVLFLLIKLIKKWKALPEE